MQKIFSNKIKEGDEIRVIAPSSSAASMKKSIFNTAVKRAEKIGIRPVFSKHAFEKDIVGSSSIQSRVEDLHEAFRNKKVKGIACARGGYSANTLLPYLDWDLIRKNPKPIWGYSDITVLSNAIYAKTGLVTYSGPSFSTFGIENQKNEVDFIIDYFTKCIMNNDSYVVEKSAWFGEWKQKSVKNKGYKIYQEGNAEGTIIGGNLCSLNLLQGTEYMPSIENSILFIEEDDFAGKDTLIEFERNLESLLQLPKAETIQAIIFGRFQKKSLITDTKFKHILKSKSISKKIPIISSVDFGHTYPMITFPIGGTAKIEATKKSIQITILEH